MTQLTSTTNKRSQRSTFSVTKAIILRGISTVVLAFISTAVFSQAEYPVFAHLDEIDKQVIPEDTTVRKGVLDNGFTYYVRRCKNPAKQAFFQLLVKGGSILENDNERGIAHFVEHMMFKGTKHFPGQEVIGFMRRNGIPFGHDSNAFTGFNTVRYVLNSIPTDNVLLMDSCLLLIRDWAGDATIAKKDVESERNVIVEEWRNRSILSFAQQMRNDFFNNSIYTSHLPIGDVDAIQNCSQKLVLDFYKRWYQPQNQAMVAVGDFDPDEMVKKIRDRFGDMKRGRNLVPTPPVIPDFETPRVRFYQDKQFPYPSILFVMRFPQAKSGKSTIGDLRTTILREEVKDIMQKKLDGIKARNEGIYGSSSLIQDLADVGTQLYFLNLDASQDNWKQTLELLAKQIEYIRRKGFKDEDWKDTYLQASPEYNADSTAIVMVDTSYVANDDLFNSRELSKIYIANFFEGDVIMSDMAKQLSERHIKNSISQEQLHKEFLDITNGRNMIAALLFPEGTTLPAEEEVTAILNHVKSMSDDELADVEVLKAKKLERIPVDSLEIPTVPGTVKKTTVLNDVISEVLLSNGVKVVFWKKETNDNSINLMIRRPSGYSVLKDDDIHYHDMLSSCVRQYSYKGGFSILKTEMFDDTYDTQVFRKEHLEGNFKMMYATLTSNEVDSVEFEERLRNLQAAAAATSNPLVQAQLKISYLPIASFERLMPPTVEKAAAYNIEHFGELVREYHSNYNGSVLVVQGEFDTDSIMPFILKYVASLPSKPEPVKRMVWPADHYKTTNTTMVEKIENPTPYCATFLIYTWQKGFEYTQETHAHNQVLQSVLSSILLNTLRVQHSDVYTPGCVVNDGLLPINFMNCTIAYTCNPTQRERIAKDVDQLIHNMADGNLITQELIDSYVKECEKKEHLYKGNDFTLRRDYLTHELNGIVVREGDTTYIKQVTPASLKAHLKQLLKKGNIHIGYLTTE